MVSALCLAVMSSRPPAALDVYLRRPEPAFTWRVASESTRVTDIRMTSQTWQGMAWTHDLVLVKPSGKPVAEDKAILFITGNRAAPDIPVAQALANRSGYTVAVLFNIPNQPIFGKSEDALIAETFGRYMATKDASWPLLFPMTKAAHKAMDVVQQHSKGRIRSFVVTGASKRGWTTWLVGAARDKRVAALAPMVIDVLNMPKQLEHQKAMFGGKLSEQISDYSESGLTELLSSAEGRQLSEMVDPYSYLPRITVPVLAIIGGNDRYWTVDAHTLYWPSIRGRKLLKIVPNAGHNLGDGREAIDSLSMFSRAVFGDLPGGLPRVDWRPGDRQASPDPARDKRLKEGRPWVALSESLDFRDSRWMDARTARIDGAANRAEFTEYVFEAGGLRAGFNTGVVVTKGQPR